jgi:hypothetical protein
MQRRNGIREITMTDKPDVSLWRKLIGITLLSSLFVLPAPVLAQDIVSATAVAADPLRLAAEDVTSCRELRDPDVRLACFDSAAHQLAEALGSMDQAGRNAVDLPVGPDAPDAPAAVEPSGAAAEHPPNWASAPEHREIEQAEIPRRFEATIVRITINNVGRHRFYTEDGAVWEQTQIAEVRQPRSLPAVAEFHRKLTGNPTIKFDVSSRSYRVRRID